MTRRAARTDANQAEIVEVLRQIGATVCVLSAIGKGCPDLLVGVHGVNYLMELKDGSKPPSARKLTRDEVLWHTCWRGQVAVVESVADALACIATWGDAQQRRAK